MANTAAMAISFPLPVRREGLAILACKRVKVEPLSTTANKRGLLTLILILLVLQLGGGSLYRSTGHLTNGPNVNGLQVNCSVHQPKLVDVWNQILTNMLYKSRAGNGVCSVFLP
jgi:hypothetical protein